MWNEEGENLRVVRISLPLKCWLWDYDKRVCYVFALSTDFSNKDIGDPLSC